MATVSVVIPTHNRREKCKRAIESVLAQDTSDSIEIIVVDDASQDGTSGYLAELFGNRIIILRTDVRHPGIARNVGAKHASGHYLAFLDSDDVWTHDKLSVQLELLGRTGARWTYADAVRPNGILWRSRNCANNRFNRLMMACAWNLFPTPTLVVERELFVQVGGFSESPQLRICEDYVLTLRLTLKTPGVRWNLTPLAHLDEDINDSLMGSNRRAAIRNARRMFAMLLSGSETCGSPLESRMAGALGSTIWGMRALVYGS